MTAFDRTERFSGIRTRLGFPFEQRPSPHRILHQMLSEEQSLLLRLTNTGAPFSLVSTTITTVSGTSQYAITQPISSHQHAVKAYYCVRTTGNNDLPFLNVPFDDFSSLNYGELPGSGQVNASLSVPELISFYRKDAQDQTLYAVIQPTPQEVLTYTVWFFVGAIDKAYALMSQVGPMPELNDYLELKSCMALLPDSQWDEDRDVNDEERKTRAAAFQYQLGDINRPGTLEYTVDKFIRSITAPADMDMGLWND